MLYWSLLNLFFISFSQNKNKKNTTIVVCIANFVVAFQENSMHQSGCWISKFLNSEVLFSIANTFDKPTNTMFSFVVNIPQDDKDLIIFVVCTSSTMCSYFFSSFLHFFPSFLTKPNHPTTTQKTKKKLFCNKYTPHSQKPK